MKRLLIAVALAALVWQIPRPCSAQGLDQYGGSLDLQCPDGATGNFYAQEIGNRWWLCDPLGGAYWAISVFNVWWGPAQATQKYGTFANWSALTTARLKRWGFNTVDGDSSEGLWPQETSAGWPGDHTQPNKMALLYFVDMASYPPRGPFNYCSNANLDQTKAFGSGDDPLYWNFSNFVSIDDPFDPCFSAFGYGYLGDVSQTSPWLPSPWTLGIETAEGDYERGFGAGPSVQDGPTGALNTSQGFATVGALGNNNANLGLAVLAAAPRATYNNNWSRIALRGREVYVKQEMANWLQGNGQVAFNDPVSASSSSGTVTMAFSANLALAYAAGDKINVQACSDANFNGSGLAVLTASGQSITYTEPISDTASGVKYCVVSLTGAVITAATLASGSETVTMAVNPYKTGDIVTITGASPTGFNTTGGTGCGVTAYTATTFTCTNGSGSATFTSGGVASSGPGYTLAELNTAWGSSYTTWGSLGTNYIDTISTSGTPAACNRTTWVCTGTLAHVPDMYSVWVKDNGTPVAATGSATLQNGLYEEGGAGMVVNYCSPTRIVDNAGSVTVTCSVAQSFTVGDKVVTYMKEEGNPFGGVTLTLTSASGNTIGFTSGGATWTVSSPYSGDYFQDASQVDFTNGNFYFKFPSTALPGASDTITVDYYSGGYGSGTGFLDEAGQHAWTGMSDNVSLTASALTNAFRNDMNDFIYHFSATWFSIARNVVKSNFPTTMFLGANEAGGSWCTPARVPVLRAIGQYVDFAPAGGLICGDPTDQARLDYAENYMNNLPVMLWTGITANADSSQPYSQSSMQLPAAWNASTQASRGQAYMTQIEEFINMRVDPGNGAASGQYPFVGIHLWDGGSDDSSAGNWGLTTNPNDSAYDGRCAVKALSVGPLGYPCGGEAADYGDSLDEINAANTLWLNLIPRKLASGTVGGSTQ